MAGGRMVAAGTADRNRGSAGSGLFGSGPFEAGLFGAGSFGAGPCETFSPRSTLASLSSSRVFMTAGLGGLVVLVGGAGLLSCTCTSRRSLSQRLPVIQMPRPAVTRTVSSAGGCRSILEPDH